MLLVVGLLVTVWTAWFFAVPVRVYEVTENARLEVESAAHPVSVQLDGRVTVTNLSIGRDVQKDEIVLVLDSEDERLALSEHRATHDGLTAELVAQRARIAAENEAASRHRAARHVAIQEARAAVEESEARSKYSELQLDALERLRARAATSRDEYARARAEAEALRALVKSTHLAPERLERELEAEATDHRARIAAFEVDAVRLASEIATESAIIRRLEHAVTRRYVRAPISGCVGAVAPTLRVGAVVRVGETVASIVPHGEARAVALFPVAALGRIHTSQRARLRLQGFPWTQYGPVQAQVDHVGNEPNSGLIRVELILIPDPRSPIPITHGLPGTAEVEVERVSPATLVLRSAGHYLSARRGMVMSPQDSSR